MIFQCLRTVRERTIVGTTSGCTPTISIVTPSLNQGAFIERTIKSVIQQGYPKLEYIIQDGLSRDETVEVLSRLAGRPAAEVVDAIDHVHYSDTDTTTSELHFPPGEGVLDLDAIGARIAGRPIAVSWDLFGWPGPRHAVGSLMDVYRAFVERHAASRRH